jgi:hypothetical protein
VEGARIRGRQEQSRNQPRRILPDIDRTLPYGLFTRRHSLLMVPLRCGLLFLRCISVEPIKQVILLNENYFTCGACLRDAEENFEPTPCAFVLCQNWWRFVLMRPPNLHCSPGTPLPLRPLRAGGAICRAWHHTQQWGSLSVSACTRGGQAACPSANEVATLVAPATGLACIPI